MRFLFVDRVLRLERRKSLEAVVTLSPDEPVFAIHFPGNPMFPASLSIETLAQAATILLEVSSGFTKKAIPGFVREAKFRRAVRPSLPLRIVVEVDQWSDEGALIRGRIEQGGAPSVICVLGMVTAPLSDFYRPEDASAYRAMYERWLEGAALEGFDAPALSPLRESPAAREIAGG